MPATETQPPRSSAERNPLQDGIRPNDPLRDAVAYTPSDTQARFTPTRGLYVGTAGDVTIKTLRGSIVTLKNLAAGVIHPISCVHVMATGTTALDVVLVF